MSRRCQQFAGVRKPARRLAIVVVLVGYASSAIAQIPGAFTAPSASAQQFLSS
jgi:hypothetical protein